MMIKIRRRDNPIDDEEGNPCVLHGSLRRKEKKNPAINLRKQQAKRANVIVNFANKLIVKKENKMLRYLFVFIPHS